MKFQYGPLAALYQDQEAVGKLSEKWTIDRAMFVDATQPIPSEMPLSTIPKFTNDRID